METINHLSEYIQSKDQNFVKYIFSQESQLSE